MNPTTFTTVSLAIAAALLLISILAIGLVRGANKRVPNSDLLAEVERHLQEEKLYALVAVSGMAVITAAAIGILAAYRG